MLHLHFYFLFSFGFSLGEIKDEILKCVNGINKRLYVYMKIDER